MPGLSPMFSMGAVFRRIEKFADERTKMAFLKLAYIGEEAVNDARITGLYTDRTGNLRSSIGWIVLINGKIEKSGIKEAERGTDRKTGVKTGKGWMQWASNEFKDESMVLVIFAGMEYAASVESKGYDVLSSAVPLAQFLKKELDEV